MLLLDFIFPVTIVSYRLSDYMGEHYLVLHIEHLGGLALLLQQLFLPSNLCPYQDLEVVVFLLLLHLMMDFLLINLMLKQPLKTFSFIGKKVIIIIIFYLHNFVLFLDIAPHNVVHVKFLELLLLKSPFTAWFWMYSHNFHLMLNDYLTLSDLFHWILIQKSLKWFN